LGTSVAALLIWVLTTSTASAQAWWNHLEDGFLPVPSVGSSLPNRGDPGGARQWLGDRGVVIGFEYTADVLSNVSGGNIIGTIYQGKLQGVVSVDFSKWGLDGLSAFANFFQIHNTGRMRRDYVGGINTIAAIEAVPTTRLSELWLEQSFAGGNASLRIGQLAADSEFFIGDLSTFFLQSDWPTITAANLPSGGAAYPLTTPGVRLKVQPLKELTVLVALMNGDPAGPGVFGEEQLRNYNGLNFRLGDAPLLIGEIQYRWNADTAATGLARTLKLGGWRHFGWFDDQSIANDGTLLGDPSGSGVPWVRLGNAGLYYVIDQQLWRPDGGGPQHGVSVFSRGSWSPPDRNLIGLYIDGGFVAAGLVPGRPYDKFGASVIHARFSSGSIAHDRNLAFYTGTPVVVREHETNLELAYFAQIVPGWTFQPTLQFIWNPNGDATRNAVVIGARTLIRY
jgi:porin